MKNVKYILALIILVSCKARYFVNVQGGVRPKKNNMFSYDDKNFVLQSNQLIDTNYIYVRMDTLINNDSDSLKSLTVYFRFWGNGRVQEVWSNNKDLSSDVNNIEVGYIGYYYIKKDRLKMELIEITNGGQVSHRYGLFDNGDICFYNQSPETYFGSWIMLKWLESKNKTKWTKTKVDSLRYVKPTW